MKRGLDLPASFTLERTSSGPTNFFTKTLTETEKDDQRWLKESNESISRHVIKALPFLLIHHTYMCGIGLYLFPTIGDGARGSCSDSDNINDSSSSSSFNHDAFQASLVEVLASRGPDYQSHTSHDLFYDEIDSNGMMMGESENENNNCTSITPSESENNHVCRIPLRSPLASNTSRVWKLNLYASVLHMRGKELTPQPYQLQASMPRISSSTTSSSSSCQYSYSFCWNGECYSHDYVYKYKYRCQDEDEVDEQHENKNTYPYGYDMAQEKAQESVDKECENNNNNNDDGNKNDQVSDTVMVMNILQDAMKHAHTTDNDTDNDDDKIDNDKDRDHYAIANALSHVHGEYSFILHCQPTPTSTSTPKSLPKSDSENDQGCIYFGRDPLGRRSLLISKCNDDGNVAVGNIDDNREEDGEHFNSCTPFVLSSAAPQSSATSKSGPLQMDELPAGRVYRLDLNTGNLCFVSIPPRLRLPMSIPNKTIIKTSEIQIPLPQWQTMKLKFDKEPNASPQLMQAAKDLYTHLDTAVRRRVLMAPTPKQAQPQAQPQPKPKPQNLNGHTHNNHNKSSNQGEMQEQEQATVAVLFSGGVDSVVLAALCHNHVPPDEHIDLINIAFATTGTGTGTGTQKESTTKTANNEDPDPFSLSPDRQAALLSFSEMQERWPQRKWRFIAVNVEYSEVVREEKRICGLISPLNSTMDFNIGTAFWFASQGSGLIVDKVADGMGMQKSEHLRFATDAGDAAAATCTVVTSNATEKSIARKVKSNANCSMHKCERKPHPDCCFGACKSCCSGYQKRINQFLGGRGNVCPIHNNQSKGSKGKKKKQKQKKLPNISESKLDVKVKQLYRQSFTSHARVVLVGIGADEQMAGYGRHRTTYIRGGYDALREELKMEKSRLWTRNLGRDDRCISSHGKEARFPFLDEHVVDFLNSLDVEEFCDMDQPQGVGDKMILRLIAKNLGVTQCSGLVKRAIQFGSRIAKCSDVNRFGSSRKASGTAQLLRTHV